MRISRRKKPRVYQGSAIKQLSIYRDIETSNYTNDPYRKSYLFRLKVNKKQKEHLKKIIGVSKWIHNYFKEDIEKDLVNGKKIKSLAEFMDIIYKLRYQSGLKWLRRTPKNIIKYSLFNLLKAYDRYLKGYTKKPKFKSKFDKNQVILDCNSFKFYGDKLKLRRLKTAIPIIKSQDLPNNLTKETCTIFLDSDDKFYVNFINKAKIRITNGDKILGIDAGLSKLAIFSDRRELENPKYYKKSLKKINKIKKTLKRKQKNSRNFFKTKSKLAKANMKIRRQRLDYLHKLTTNIVKESKAVCIERLDLEKMMSKGNFKHHIADAGWRLFRKMLRYKTTQSTGCKLFLADPYFPSTHLCSDCNRKPTKKMGLWIREWKCEFCGSVHNRDVNAAINLKNLAIKNLYTIKPGQIAFVGKYRF